MGEIGFPHEFGAMVRQARRSRGLSQEALAELAAVGKRFVSDLERGKPTAELGKALKVSRALGITLAATPPEQDLDRLLAAVRSCRRELEKQGVRHVGVFGSTARRQNRANSDVDLLVEYDKKRVKSLLQVAAIHKRLEEIVGRPVDIAERARLKTHVAPFALADVVDAF